MNILVIRFSSLGDVILAAPVFSFLRDRYPDANITLLTRSRYCNLFIDDPRVNKVLCMDRGELPRQFLDGEWDSIIDLQANSCSRKAVRRVGGEATVGRFQKNYFKRFMLLVFRINLYNPAEHVICRYARAAGYSEKTCGPLPSPVIERRNDSFERDQRLNSIRRSGKPVLALMPFGAWKNKEWPVASYEQVGAQFISSGWQVVIMGGPGEKEKAAKLKSRLGPMSISFAGELPVESNIPVFKLCRLSLGNDSGLSHLARASGVKTGIIYGATSWHFGFSPCGEPAFRIFQKPLCC
ncbi:MAG: hypothetical protein GF350_16295, partial [Chitinivibrionales bacterium]|nr:hypothetical protein [Chitinivibrionales bacterium]